MPRGPRSTLRLRARVAADLLKKLGLNVEIAASDWGNLVIRQGSKAPVDKGGWNAFGTGAVGSDGLDPTLNPWLRTNGEAARFGWPSDDEIEALRQQWIEATDTPSRIELAAAIQVRAFEVVPLSRPGNGRARPPIART